MDSSALGSELKRKLKKASSTGSILKSESGGSATSSTASPPPPLPSTPPRPLASPTAHAAPTAVTKPPSAPPPPQQKPPPAAATPSPLKPIVPKTYLEEDRTTAQPSARRDYDQDFVHETEGEGEDETAAEKKLPTPEKLPKSAVAVVDDDDDWGSGDDDIGGGGGGQSSSARVKKAQQEPVLTVDQIQPYLLLVQHLRGFFPLLPNRQSLDLELSNGIALCRKVAGMYAHPVNEQILGEVAEDYSPALAVVSEWRNVRLFVRHVLARFPRLSVEFPYGEEHLVGDLLNQTNLARFFSLLLAFAKECGYASSPPSASPLSAVDVTMLQRQPQYELQQALRRFQESTYDEAKLTHPVYLFLKSLGLQEHFSRSIDLGYDTLDRLALITREDAADVMCGKPGHVRQLVHACRQMSRTNSQSAAERVFEFHHSQPLADEFWLNEERAKLQQLSRVKTRQNNSTVPAFRDALECTDYLLSLTSVPSVSTTAVLDFASGGGDVLLFGFAGSTSPVGQLELLKSSGVTRFAIVEDGVTRALQRLGKQQIKRMMLVGVALNAAVLDFCVQTCPAGGVFLCGPKSTSALGMRVFGLMDGVCVDMISASSSSQQHTARASAVRHGQVLPQATVVASLGGGGGEGEDGLSKCIESCLAECVAKPGARVKGGLVIMGSGSGGGGGSASVSRQVAERFSCGVFHLQFACSRWACAAQIAVHPNFQHRWVTAKQVAESKVNAAVAATTATTTTAAAAAVAVAPAGLEDELFPLVSFDQRKSLVSKSICALHVLHRMVIEEEQALEAREHDQQQQQAAAVSAAKKTPSPRASPAAAKLPPPLSRPRVPSPLASSSSRALSTTPTPPLAAKLPPTPTTTGGQSKVAAAVAAVEAKKSVPVSPPHAVSSPLMKRPSPKASTASSSSKLASRPVSTSTASSSSTTTTTTTDKFDRVKELFRKLETLLPRAAFLDAKAFILKDVADSSQPTDNLLDLTLKEVIQRLPQDIRSKLSPDVIIMDDDDDDEGGDSGDDLSSTGL